MRLGIDDREELEEAPLDFEAPGSGFAGIASMIGTKNLLIAIITMPFVFLLVVMSILAVFGGKGNDEAGVAASGAVRSQPAQAVLTIEEPEYSPAEALGALPASANGAPPITLPAGAEAGAISLDGDRLAVRIDGPNGAQIVIYDLTTDEIVKTISLAPQQ